MTFEELRQDIEKMHQLHEEIVENKDKYIKVLEDHIVELRAIIETHILKKKSNGESNNQV